MRRMMIIGAAVAVGLAAGGVAGAWAQASVSSPAGSSGAAGHSGGTLQPAPLAAAPAPAAAPETPATAAEDTAVTDPAPADAPAPESADAAEPSSEPSIVATPAEEPEPASAQPEGRVFERTRIIVKFRDGADPATVMAEALAADTETFDPAAPVTITPTAIGAATVDLAAAMGGPSGPPFAVEPAEGSGEGTADPLGALVERLNADPRVEYAEKNYVSQAM